MPRPCSCTQIIGDSIQTKFRQTFRAIKYAQQLRPLEAWLYKLDVLQHRNCGNNLDGGHFLQRFLILEKNFGTIANEQVKAQEKSLEQYDIPHHINLVTKFFF